jgi:hypothetical protein
MEKKYQKVKFEVFTFSGGPLGSTYTLKLNDPAQVTFECFGGSLLGVATINNSIFLFPYIDTITGLANLPYNKIFETKRNEIDTTVYTLNVSSPNIFVKVTCKYYVKE